MSIFRSGILGITLLICGAMPSLAMTGDDMLKLKAAELEESIILEQLRKEGLDTELTVDDLIALKQAGFTGDFIKQALLMPVGRPAPESANEKEQLPPVDIRVGGNPPMPQPAPPAAPVAEPVPVAVEASTVSLTIINRDSRSFSLRVDAETRDIIITEMIEGYGTTLRADEGYRYTLPAGTYRLRFAGEDTLHELPLYADTELALQTGAHDGRDTLDFVLRDGRDQIAGGVLKYFPVVIVERRAPETRVIVREEPRIVYVDPSPTVIVRDYSSCSPCYPVVYSRSSCGPIRRTYYSSGCSTSYYPRYYSHHHHKGSSWSVGFRYCDD